MTALRSAALSILLAVAALPAGSGPGAATAAPTARPQAADPYLKLVLDDPQGRRIRLSEFKGKVRVFDIWASWCGPCRMGIPALNTLYERYRDKGVVVVGVSLDDTPADVVRFTQEVPIRYPLGMMNPELAAVLGIGHGEMAIPLTFVVDRGGKLRARFTGLVSAARIESAVAGLL